jgi:hypothetical protein
MFFLFLSILASVTLFIAVWHRRPRRGIGRIFGVCLSLAIIFGGLYHWMIGVLCFILACGVYCGGPFTSWVRYWGREDYALDMTGYCVDPSGDGVAMLAITHVVPSNSLTNFDFVDARFTRSGGRGSAYRRTAGIGAVTFTAHDLQAFLTQLPPERWYWQSADGRVDRRQHTQEPVTPSGPRRAQVFVPVSLVPTQQWWLRITHGPQHFPHTEEMPLCSPSHPHFRVDGIPLSHQGQNILVELCFSLPPSQQTHYHWWYAPVQGFFLAGAALDAFLLTCWLLYCGLSILLAIIWYICGGKDAWQ